VDNDWYWRDESRQWADIPLYTKIIRWLKNRPPEERYLPFRRVYEALRVYWEHQGMHAPDRVSHAGGFKFDPGEPSSLAYRFEYGAAAFFVMDTRTMRVRQRKYRQMLGADQLGAVKDWLLEVKDRFPVKFIATSSAFLHIMLGDFAQDRWSAFKAERDEILRFIANNRIENVFFLSGDLHSGHAISANLYSPDGSKVAIWEFCASPFEQLTNYVTKFFTLRRSWYKLWRDYRVHFVVNAINYGVVSVDLEEPDKPKVRFDLHYQNKQGGWEVRTPL
jgi:hypothetical protein